LEKELEESKSKLIQTCMASSL